jgi:hypothetical protein
MAWREVMLSKSPAAIMKRGCSRGDPDGTKLGDPYLGCITTPNQGESSPWKVLFRGATPAPRASCSNICPGSLTLSCGCVIDRHPPVRRSECKLDCRRLESGPFHGVSHRPTLSGGREVGLIRPSGAERAAQTDRGILGKAGRGGGQRSHRFRLEAAHLDTGDVD